MTVAEWLERIDAELAGNTADRDAHPTDPTVEVLVAVGKLPAAALEWPGLK